VLVHGHFGPVHLPLVALARHGYRMKQIGLPSDEGLSWVGRNVAFRLRLRYEGMIPAEIVHAAGFMRPVFSWLGENGVLMVTGDGSGTDKRVGRHREQRFFGQPVPFPLGPFLIAGKTGAAVLPLFVLPGERAPYRVVVEEPLAAAGSGEERAAELSAAFVRRLEARVAAHPGWMHFLDRFCPGKMILGGRGRGAPLRGEAAAPLRAPEPRRLARGGVGGPCSRTAAAQPLPARAYGVWM